MQPPSRSVNLGLIAILFLIATSTYAQRLPRCEWCGAPEAPANLTSVLQIAEADEPGERLTITGQIVDENGKAVPNVLMYAYHTNAEGIYPKRGDETGNGQRHGYLRGWLRTDAEGRYTIRSIRPGTYPSRNEPAHIHITLLLPGQEETWVDSVVFDDDPLVDAEYRRDQNLRGGSGITTLRRDADGRWHGERTIVISADR